MKIEYYMIDTTSLPEKIQVELQQKYLEYPPNNQEVIGTIQKHGVGDSFHIDYRFPINGYLNGWAIVGFNRANQPTPESLEIGKGFRAETKGRQPKVWLFKNWKIGDTHQWKPGKIGAGIEASGEMTILARPIVKLGVQKPFFHEYFWKGGIFKEWTKITIRRISTMGIDPSTKEPTTKKVLFWKFMINKDSTPYAISNRAISKNYKPPKGIIPFPEDWVKKEYPKKYSKWLSYMKQSDISELSQVKFTLSLVSWMGPIHIRGQPRFRWFLFLDDKRGGSVRTFKIDGSPLRSKTLGIEEWDRSDRKWLDYEGIVGPDTPWVETKKLKGHMVILDKGTVGYTTDRRIKRERITLDFNGKKLQGKWTALQEESGTDFYTLEKLSYVDLGETKFVYHKHIIEGKEPHFDIRILIPKEDRLLELSLWNNILETDRTQAISKYSDKEWFITEGNDIKKDYGRIHTIVSILDTGTVHLLEVNPTLKSFVFNGKKIKGYYLLSQRDNKHYFEKSSLPGEEQSLFSTILGGFPIEEKRGWDYFYLKINDMKKYTRCESANKANKYLDIRIPSGVEIFICLFHRPETLHGAEIGMVKFHKDRWTYDKAQEWVKSKKLSSWSSTQIRESKQEALEDAYQEVLEAVRSKAIQTDEEKEINLTLKKKKLELINKFLEAQE